MARYNKEEYEKQQAKIQATIQALIDEFGLCYDTVNDFNHDYSFNYEEI